MLLLLLSCFSTRVFDCLCVWPMEIQWNRESKNGSMICSLEALLPSNCKRQIHWWMRICILYNGSVFFIVCKRKMNFSQAIHARCRGLDVASNMDLSWRSLIWEGVKDESHHGFFFLVIWNGVSFMRSLLVLSIHDTSPLFLNDHGWGDLKECSYWFDGVS